ncbi:MAG: TetR/AcrR family transcriptional regulator [Betaproteobacteria bacterium]
MENVLIPPIAQRGAATRDALLNAAEAMISDFGFNEPSHRAIAGAAGVNTTLLNYHFGSKEMLFEAAVARRAERLLQSWRQALAELGTKPNWTVEQVLVAWWLPFHAISRHDTDEPWRNYLCVIARLASASDGDEWHQRYLGSVDREFHQMLHIALPAMDQADLEAGFRYARSLFGEVLLHRCGKTGGSCSPRGFREDDVDRLIRYIAHGMRGLRTPPQQPTS